MTGYDCTLDDLHLSGIHSEWQHSVPWGHKEQEIFSLTFGH